MQNEIQKIQIEAHFRFEASWPRLRERYQAALPHLKYRNTEKLNTNKYRDTKYNYKIQLEAHIAGPSPPRQEIDIKLHSCCLILPNSSALCNQTTNPLSK